MDSVSGTQKPLIVLKARKGFSAIPFRDLLMYRDLLMTLALRDVKLRYRQTALGAIWVILQPLAGAGLFSFVFGTVAKLPSDGIPYLVFSFVGMLCWNVFSVTLGKSSASLIGNAHLVSKVYFPRLILPLSTVPGVLLDFLIGLGMFAVLAVIYGVPLSVNILALPLILAIAFMMALGLGMYFSSLMVTYRDVQYVIPVLVQFLLFASPVAFSISAIPPKFQALVGINPVVGMIEAFRWCLLGTPVTNVGGVIYSAIFAVGSFFLGALAFQRMERRFADVI
ncbi:MAG TPA: ABC transporter permease [Fimbriimonadaceae bacterium]|nr:ABC transporter permease [Fimbriimonadaceae bacterium]